MLVRNICWYIRATVRTRVRHRQGLLPRLGVALALGAWCGWASGFHQSTTPAVVTWSVSLAAVVVVDLLLARGRRQGHIALRVAPTGEPWPRPGRGGSGAPLLGTSPWLVLGIVVLAWEVLGIDTSPREPHLTISALAQAFRPLNAVLLLVWILVGIGYGVARARAPVDQGSSEPGRRISPDPSLPAVGMVLIGHLTPTPALLLPHSRGVGVTFWLAVVAAGLLVDAYARRSRGRFASAEELVRLISRPRGTRILMVVAWAFAGWHLFAH